MKKRILSLVVVMTVMFGFVGNSQVFAQTRELTYIEKLFDKDCSVGAVVKVEDVEPINTFSFLSTSSSSSPGSSSTPRFANAKASVELKKLWGGQWAVIAISMARDQNNNPIPIDEIYVKGSLYYKKDGELIYKIGEENREYGSSDVMAEIACAIDNRNSLAKGYHRFKESGFKDITIETSDAR